IDSVYAQTFTDWEMVFWDNASTDATAQIAKSYDSKLRYFRSEQTVPLGEARRYAWQRSAGEWVGFLDCDDYWFAPKLEKQMQAVSGKDHLLCYGGIREIDVDGHLLRDIIPAPESGMMLERLLKRFDINMVTPLVRRQAVERFGLAFQSNITASEEY